MPCFTTAENDAYGAIDTADQTYNSSFDSLSNLFGTALEIIDNGGEVTEEHFSGFTQVSASNAQPSGANSSSSWNPAAYYKDLGDRIGTAYGKMMTFAPDAAAIQNRREIITGNIASNINADIDAIRKTNQLAQKTAGEHLENELVTIPSLTAETVGAVADTVLTLSGGAALVKGGVTLSGKVAGKSHVKGADALTDVSKKGAQQTNRVLHATDEMLDTLKNGGRIEVPSGQTGIRTLISDMTVSTNGREVLLFRAEDGKRYIVMGPEVPPGTKARVTVIF